MQEFSWIFELSHELQRPVHASDDRTDALGKTASERAKLLVTSSYLLLVVRLGAPSSVLAPSSDRNALCY